MQDDAPERLRRWRELGLVPGAVVHIRTYRALDSLFELEIGDRVVAVGCEAWRGYSPKWFRAADSGVRYLCAKHPSGRSGKDT